MYFVGAEDQPIQITDVPQSSTGAPCPMVLSDEHSLYLAYYLENLPAGWDGTSVRVLSASEGDEPCALVSFKMPIAHMFGPPNDEAFSAHPLAARGLCPYAVFEVRSSSWLSTLERMNRVHPYHKPERYSRYKHFVFAFHDSTFECLAESFNVSLHRGNVRAVLVSAAHERDQ